MILFEKSTVFRTTGDFLKRFPSKLLGLVDVPGVGAAGLGPNTDVIFLISSG